MKMIVSIASRCALGATLVLSSVARDASAQHVHEPQPRPAVTVQLGVHAVPLLTHVSPILTGDAKTEAYLTQPTLLGDAALFGGALRAHAAISLEALTLERGELGAGNYGEGYVDRRHPHTYLHELVISASHAFDAGLLGAVSASITAGRGFAPFGTDDPMMRPFVKFPVNHHLAQILERLIVTGAVRAGPVILEAGIFNGNEPINAHDVGSLQRFGDSRAARVTMIPLPGVELQASHAAVESPELPSGGGADQSKWSASARYDHVLAFGGIYALAEWKRTAELDRGRELYVVGSALVEAALMRDGWRPALRLERTERVEEARGFDPFRTPWPHGDTHVFGMTTWTIAAARLERDVQLGRMRAAPFVEASYSHVRGGEDDLFEPAAFYGDTSIWTLNLGARLTLGSHRARMGRYGVALPAPSAMHTH